MNLAYALLACFLIIAAWIRGGPTAGFAVIGWTLIVIAAKVYLYHHR